MNQAEHQDKEEVLLPRHKGRRETFLWLSMLAAILIVVTGWILIVGKQLTGAVIEAKTGIVRVSEISNEFHETTEPALTETSEITELIIDGVKPYAEGIRQRENVLETVSEIVVDDLKKGEKSEQEELSEKLLDLDPIVNE